MYMKDEKIVEIDDYRLELENRIRNLLWTISGDYTLNMKVDVSLYLRSKAIALYDGIKQGALAKYYDKDLLGLYLVKKVFCQAGEGELTIWKGGLIRTVFSRICGKSHMRTRFSNCAILHMETASDNTGM